MPDYTLLLAELVQAVQKVNTNYDGQKLLDALKLVDGAGSGLDADLLDGQHASDFALAGSVPGAETGASILSKLLSVDGKGSGLDADLFRGFSDRLSIGTTKGEQFKQVIFSEGGSPCITLSVSNMGNSQAIAFHAYRSGLVYGNIWDDGQWKFHGTPNSAMTKAFLLAWNANANLLELFMSQGNHVADDDIKWQLVATLDTLINPSTLIAKYIEGASLPATGQNGEVVAWFDGVNTWRLAVWFDNINNWKVTTLV